MPNYKFSKKDGGPIGHAKAKEWMKKFRDKYPGDKTVIARFIGGDIVQSILDQPGCVGIRVYFGDDDQDQMEIFLVGAREDGSNIWPADMGGKDGGGGGILGDNTLPCPPYCP